MHWRMVGGSSVEELLCDFVSQKGGIVAAGMWPNLP